MQRFFPRAGLEKLIENAIRPLALGRKTISSAAALPLHIRAAIVYSLAGTCKAAGG